MAIPVNKLYRLVFVSEHFRRNFSLPIRRGSGIFLCDLRFAICDLRFAICDLRFAICDLLRKKFDGKIKIDENFDYLFGDCADGFDNG
jgi:hypothetical protein